MRRYSRALSGAATVWLARREQAIKRVASVLGIASTVAIVQHWHPWPMVFGLPFCVIWIFYA